MESPTITHRSVVGKKILACVQENFGLSTRVPTRRNRAREDGLQHLSYSFPILIFLSFLMFRNPWIQACLRWEGIMLLMTYFFK